MFDDLVTELDHDRSSPFAQFGRAVLADLSPDDLDGTSDADTLTWMRTLFAVLDSNRTVAVSNDNGRHTSIVVVAELMIGPVSNPASICMIVTPVSASPASIAR